MPCSWEDKRSLVSQTHWYTYVQAQGLCEREDTCMSSILHRALIFVNCGTRLVGWLEFNVLVQHKYGYTRDEIAVLDLSLAWILMVNCDWSMCLGSALAGAGILPMICSCSCSRSASSFSCTSECVLSLCVAVFLFPCNLLSVIWSSPSHLVWFQVKVQV